FQTAKAAVKSLIHTNMEPWCDSLIPQVLMPAIITLRLPDWLYSESDCTVTNCVRAMPAGDEFC
ncbi:MAG: hypothetical protein ABN483_11920, partial [Pantoea agglomerans]